MYNIEKLREIINLEIEKLNFTGRQPGELYQPVHYILSNGGKRMRPVFSLMACQLFSDNLSPCINPAVAIELFHNFTLLHDDIMDNSDIRRGKPTVHKKWDVNTAILSGDVMVVRSFDLISSSEKRILPQLLYIFNRTATEICEGQQMDINFESADNITEEDYMKMIKLKTSVLIAAAMQIGAIAGGASEKDAILMYECGLNLGLAFQLQDDLLDLYGEQKEFGKKTGGDIIMNKKTFLLIKALEMAKGETTKRIKHLMEEEKNPETKVAEMKKIFDELDIPSVTGKRAAYFFNNSLEKLGETNPITERKSELTGFIQAVMERKS